MSLFVNFFKGAWKKVKNNGMKKLPKEKKKEIIEKTKDIYYKSQDLKGFVDSLSLLRRSINVVKLGFDPGEEARVKQLSEKRSVLDVLKWDLARDHVTGMTDVSLSTEVPENLNYKTALLRVLQAGKAETQARIDLAEAGLISLMLSIHQGGSKHGRRTFGISYADCYAWQIARFICNICCDN